MKVDEYITKKFLTDLTQESGFVVCEVISDGSCINFIEANVKVADCNRVITLDFCFRVDDIEGIEGRIKKVDTLIGELTKFSTELEKIKSKALKEYSEEEQ